MNREKVTVRQVFRKHWLLSGLYAIGILIVLFITVNRIAEIPWRYYRYWQTAGLYLFCLIGYSGVNVLSFLLLRKSSRWRLLFLPSLLCFICIAESRDLSIRKTDDKFECVRRLKQISAACFSYAELMGEYPDTLESLQTLDLLDENSLTCPGNHWHNPGDIDYLYFGKDVKYNREEPDKVLLQDKPENHPAHFCSKVFFSGDVVRMTESFR
ncbi:MAG: hypothetical protein J6W81_00030 [Lentisphaeria bacterium]|nr:hypothetical protein [Lentisphaeria bacterium]